MLRLLLLRLMPEVLGSLQVCPGWTSGRYLDREYEHSS
jgi:hypothetical protein